MFQETRILEETIFNNKQQQQPVMCAAHSFKNTQVTHMIQPLSAEAFALASNVLHVTNLHCSPQLVQLAQPQHLLGRQAVIGALHLHQLQGKGDGQECAHRGTEGSLAPTQEVFFYGCYLRQN